MDVCCGPSFAGRVALVPGRLASAAVVGVVAGVCSPPDFGMTVFFILLGGTLGLTSLLSWANAGADRSNIAIANLYMISSEIWLRRPHLVVTSTTRSKTASSVLGGLVGGLRSSPDGNRGRGISTRALIVIASAALHEPRSVPVALSGTGQPRPARFRNKPQSEKPESGPGADREQTKPK
jgi:hypothetical protein